MLKVVLRNLLDVTTLMTPGGIPASSARDAKARAGKGVWRCLINTVYQKKEKRKHKKIDIKHQDT